MSFLRQTWTLSNKTIKIALGRHTFSTLFRAFLLPVVYIVFLSYARNNLVFVNSGYSGGNIDKVIDIVAAQVSGKTITRLSNTNDLLTTCPGTLRGVSACYGAVVFNGSPTEGSGGFWNYTLRADASLATKIDVNSGTNDAEIYGLPLQRAVDMAIASLNTTIDQAAIPSTVNEYPFTSITEAAENLVIRVAYNKLIITALAAAFLVSMVGIVYHMAGFIAMEREVGMSHLIEAMMPNKRRWVPQICE
jgi:ATP-binding cassette subfamily A (ABC1) protein 3